MIGERFGRLVVVGRAPNKGRHSAWLCRCDCGNETTVFGTNLRRGLTASCKCLHKERTSAASKTHGLSRSRIYTVWRNMHARCADASDPRYGGRGIKVCARWAKFENFLADMGAPPSSKHTLDRRDNDGDYDKRNCRWATPTIQARNTSKNRKVRYQGMFIPLVEQCERARLPYKTVHARLKRGWPVYKALSTPLS